MKNLRKELIDFVQWYYEEGYAMHYTSARELVSLYMKSINSAQSEALSVGNNEQAKEDCPECGSSLLI